MVTETKLRAELADAERRAWDAASRNKWWMFGYYAARVHYLRDLLGEKGRAPFFEVKMLARRRLAQLPPPRRTLLPLDADP